MPIDHGGFDQRVTVAKKAAESAGTYELAVVNPTDYAAAVDSIEGIDIFNPPHQRAVAAENVAAVPAGRPASADFVRALDKAGFEEVAHLRSLTDATTDDGRRKHPTGFADVTGQLANGYGHEARKL